MPVWYWYADPTTITGENWWQFQYSIALAGYTMDDYINHTSALETGTDAVTPTERAELQRLNYASKLGAIANVNSGQISNVPANIGASAVVLPVGEGQPRHPRSRRGHQRAAPERLAGHDRRERPQPLGCTAEHERGRRDR